jgi:GPH family glycoside/pentoside/hexuronide:cation symporter
MISAIGTACIIAALPYFAEYILGDEGFSTIGLAIYVATAALSIPIWNILTKKYDKRKLILIGCCVFAAILVPIAFVITVDLAIYFYLGCGILGIFMGSYLLIAYSLIPDMVDYYEHTKGERHESIFFGVWNTSHQIGAALAGLILGSLLKAFKYDANLINQPESALLGIRIVFGVVPGVFLIIAMIILQFYGITKQVYTKMVESETGIEGD